MAGIKNSYPINGCNIPGAKILAGSFVTDGAAAPTVYMAPEMTISAAATGVYTVTLADGLLAGAVALGISIEDSTADANDTVRFGDLDAITTAGTFTIITASAAGTDADLTGPEVHFALLVWDTSISR